MFPGSRVNDDGGENTGAELSENREIVLFVCCPTKNKIKKTNTSESADWKMDTFIGPQQFQMVPIRAGLDWLVKRVVHTAVWKPTITEKKDFLGGTIIELTMADALDTQIAKFSYFSYFQHSTTSCGCVTDIGVMLTDNEPLLRYSREINKINDLNDSNIHSIKTFQIY